MRQTIFVLLAVIGMLPASLLPVLVSIAHGGLGLTITLALLCLLDLGSMALIDRDFSRDTPSVRRR